MNIKKRVQGAVIDIQFEKIKEYKDFDLYQVYKVIGDKRIPLYTECFTDTRLEEIRKNRNVIEEEAFVL